MARILFVDDDAGGRQMGTYNLRKAGHEVDEAEDGAAGLTAFASRAYDVVITDLKMPRLGGLELLREIRGRGSDVPVLVITAFGSIETAVEAMRAGAFDFVAKPFNREQLLLTVGKALERRRLQTENRELRARLGGVERPILFASAAMRSVVDVADRVAASDASVLITGESGTGKELVARRIHARGQRGEGPFVAINCAAIPRDLLEAELFGHEKGAFTGAARARLGRFRKAERGTLFLDEVGELPIELQGKLLRVAQESIIDPLGSDSPVPVDVRLVAASRRDLRTGIREGWFREDLYYRLNVVEVAVPPLRERREDIRLLAEQFVRQAAPGRDLELGDDVLALLEARDWPGNVRELQNACERMAILCRGTTLAKEDLPDEVGLTTAGQWPPLPAEGFSLLDLEKRVIERALALRQGNVSAAARYLGVPRHVLAYRLEKYGISRHGR